MGIVQFTRREVVIDGHRLFRRTTSIGEESESEMAPSHSAPAVAAVAATPPAVRPVVRLTLEGELGDDGDCNCYDDLFRDAKAKKKSPTPAKQLRKVGQQRRLCVKCGILCDTRTALMSWRWNNFCLEAPTALRSSKDCP